MSLAGPGACTVCGRPPAGVYEVSLHDEVTCAVHPVRVRCLFCGRPGADAEPVGWRPFPGPLMLPPPRHSLRGSQAHSSLMRCPTCVADAVETQEQARLHLPSVRHQMAEIGVELPRRVRVRVVGAHEAAGPSNSLGGGVLAGLTDQWIGGAGDVRVTGIRIVAGLPATYFGRAVAHEIGHAWLALHGRARPVAEVEEGLCELFAYAWLKRRRTAIAEALRDRMRANPDPVYGEGFRRVHAVVQSDGVTTVLDRLLRTGTLA